MVTSMVSREALDKVRETLDEYVGEKVFLSSKLGRNRTEYKEAVITNTYSNVFNIVDESNNKCSYSYTDIITNNLQLSFGDGENIDPYDYSVSLNARF